MTTSATEHRNGTIRILLADDHPVVRIGVRNMLRAEGHFDVVGEASDGDEAITQTLELLPDILLLDLSMPRMPGLEAMRAIMSGSPRVKILLLTATISTQTLELLPDILLLDLSMPRMPGLEAMRAIMSGSPRVKILLLTATISTQQVIEALQIGARGIVTKDALIDQLTGAIAAVMQGDYWINGQRVVNLVGALHDLMQKAAVPERKTYGLTPRELEVVGCIVEGCSNRDIAKQFTISEETVKRHLSNIFDKTGVSTRLELALFAIAHQLIMPQP